MASEEDAALLALIHQHLKLNGYQKAAKVLEEHVTQVETPEQSSNLHDIYTGWIKLCSPARHGTQESEDSNTLEKNHVKPEPASSDDEDCDTKLCNIADIEAKPTLESRADGVESSHAELPCLGEDADAVPELLLDVEAETKALDSDEERSECSDRAEEGEGKEETKTELQSAPVEVFAEASNGAESCSSDSSDDKDELETIQNDPTLDASNQAEDLLQPSEPPERSGSDGERSEENKNDDEPKQEKEVVDPSVTDETSEQKAASQVETTVPCTQEEDEDGSAERSLPEPRSSDLTAQKTTDQSAESKAPPSADSDCENPESDGLENNSTVGGRTSPLEPDDQLESSTADERVSDTDVRVVAAEDPADPEDIILNIRVEDCEVPVEPAESCKDPQTLKKKKKKSKKETQIPSADALSETPLTSASARKKKRDKKRHEEVAEEGDAPKTEEKAEDESQVAPAKKRKREKHKVETEDPPVTPSENKIKKNKLKKENGVVKVEHPPDATEKKKKKRKKKKEEEEVQSDEQPAGGNEDTEEKLNVSNGNLSQPSAKKKNRLRKKLSLKKRLRLHKKEERRRKSINPAAGQTATTNIKKQKHNQDAKEETKPTKRPRPDPTQEGDTPKKKKKIKPEQEENSSKENRPPKTKKQKKKIKLVEDDESELIAEFPDVFPSPQPKRQKKKKKSEQASATASQDSPAKKKNRFEEELEEAQSAADTDTPASKKKKKSSKRKMVPE